MKRCTICHATYPASFTHCPHDGSLLTEANEWSDGAIIRGKYRILNKLGQGGMATVYKALHLGFDEVCALKVISLELASDQSFVKRFGQEAAIARKLQHPNAVRVEDIDQADDGRPFIVMEFIQGESLKDVIQRQAPLPVTRVCSISKQVAAALDAAHNLGMIHRDIKPGNILLTRPAGPGDEEVAKVLDFGIAKIKEAHIASGGATLTRTGTFIGTPAYMSPEQAMGKPGNDLDGRADLYSLGIVMYEMLTGELPIQAESEVQMLMGQINREPQPIRARRPELPEGIGAVIMRCLEKDPARRPPSGASLIAQIEAAETGYARAPDEAPTVATVRPPVQQEATTVLPPRRSPALWIGVLLTAVVLALVVIVGAALLQSRRKHVAGGASVPQPRAASQSPGQAVPIPVPPPMPDLGPVPPQPEPRNPEVTPPAAEQDSNPADDIGAALKAAPMDPKTRAQVQKIWRKAAELMKKGDFEGAAAQYRRLARLRPGWGPVAAALDAAMGGKGNWAAAAEQAKRALESDPTFAAGGSALGRALNRTGELTGAVARYSVMVSQHPEVSSHHYNLGRALGRLGDLESDRREQQEALRLDPNCASAHAELGYIESHKDAWSAAEREYREAIRLKPDLAEAHSGLGNALSHLGDWQGAIAEERTAIQQAPGLAIAHFQLAAALEHEGETAAALDEYRQATGLDPQNANFQASYQRLARESDNQ